MNCIECFNTIKENEKSLEVEISYGDSWSDEVCSYTVCENCIPLLAAKTSMWFDVVKRLRPELIVEV